MGIQIAICLAGVLGGSLILCGQAAGEDNTSAFRNHFSMRFNISSRLRPMESLHAHSLRTFPSLCLGAITEGHPADPDLHQVMGLSKVSPQTMSCPTSYVIPLPQGRPGASRKVSGIALAAL